MAASWGWRNLFLLATLPGLVLAFGFMWVAKEGRALVPAVAQPSFFSGLASIAKGPVLRLTILGYVLQTFALNGIAMFVVRHVANLGMPDDMAAKYFGINLAITGFVGALGGGQLASRLVANSTTPVRGLLLFVGITTMIGVPFLSSALMLSTPWMFFSLCFVAQIALFAGTAPLNSVLVARAPTGLEAFTQGMTIFAIQLFGSALAPVMIGWVADILMSSTGLTEGRALAWGLQISSIAMILAALIWLAAAREERKISSSAS